MPLERSLGNNVIVIAVSPDNVSLATGDAKGVVRILDLATMNERFHFQSGEDIVTSLKFNPDSKRLLVAGSTVPVVWDIEKRQKLFDLDRSVSGRKVSAPKAFFSSDGSLIVVATVENRALIYDGKTGALLHELKGPTFEELIEGYPDDGNWGVSDPITRKILQADLSIFGLASDVAFSPDGNLVAITGSVNPQSSVWLFDTRSGAQVRTLRGNSGSLFTRSSPGNQSTLAFSADGSVIVAAPTGDAINVWSVETGNLKFSIAGDHVTSLVLTQDGRGVISGEGDGNLVVHCIDGASNVVNLQSHTRAVQKLILDPTNKLLVSASPDRTARVWVMPEGSEICVDRRGDRIREALAKRRPLAILSGHNARVTDATFASNSNILITSSQDGSVRRWSLQLPESMNYEPSTEETKRKIRTKISDIGLIDNLLVSGDNKTIFTEAAFDWFAWDLASNKKIALGFRVERIATGDENTPPVLFSHPLVSQVFNSKSYDDDSFNRFTKNIEDQPQGKIEFVPDDPVAPSGTQAVMASVPFDSLAEGAITPRNLVETSTGKILGRLTFKDYNPVRFFFSPDGKRLFGAFSVPEKHGTIVVSVWDASTGNLIATSDEIADAARENVIVSRDGHRILFAGEPGSDKSRLVELSGNGIRQLKVPPTGSGFTLARSIQSITMASGGEFIVAGHNDGSIAVVSINSQKLLNILDTRGLSVNAVILSSDDKFLAAVDASNTLWVFELSTGAALRSYTMKTTPSGLRFFRDSRKIVIANQVGTLEVIDVIPSLPGLHDPQELADWARATRFLSISPADLQRYGITGRRRVTHPALDAIRASPLPSKYPNPSPGAEASACDTLADNPYDRDRRTAGIVFERFDAAPAQKICAVALAKYPNDATTRYHVARIQDRLGAVDAAMEGYRALSELGYAAAMRGVARLIDLDSTGRFSDLGTSASWIDRSAEAGDSMAYILIATRIASEDHDKDSMNQILARVETAGFKNRSEALMVISTWLGLDKQNPDKQKRALFFELAGLELNETMADAAPFRDQTLLARIRQSVRNEAAILAPREFLDVYREVRSWVSSSI